MHCAVHLSGLSKSYFGLALGGSIEMTHLTKKHG